MYVELQARVRMPPAEIDFAGRDLEMPVNEMNQTVRQISRKIRPVVADSVFQNSAASHIRAEFFVGELVCKGRFYRRAAGY